MSTHDEHAGNGLTPEERALAQRLARLGPHAEPSPALDAKILAAAHAAAEPEPIRPRRREGRKAATWPTVFGFAASLALACGIAWQLRPLPNVPSAARPSGGDDAVEFKKTEPSMSVQSVPRRKLEIPEAPPPAAPPRPMPRTAVRPPTEEERQEKPQAFEAPAIVLDEAVHPRQAAAAAAPAPPPPPAEAANAAADMVVELPPNAPAPAAAPAAKAAAAASLGALQRAADQAERAREEAEPQYAEPDEEVVPPATTGSPEVRDAWLQRIRELQKAGNVEDARVSLKAFRKRYPEYVIPEDLRPLEK
ncbi:hypothetical protein LVB87_09430 [Lysobacter sp. KIS68-7]|uniref:hypothetical protein n=1 Tax=Lysobacter sp. KIS68-7 TaxID=2904252 RepID=UPI001E52F953|nr:hypothetical protein [Lysobacter sp. KIS68-7]UHQ18435.1 hypothetical protein LVB87_09430 [Lysobacter sp. KIS68-7]